LWRTFHSDSKRKKLPNGGIFNDFDAVAAYSPFCDAMFVDKEVCLLASGKELKRELSGRARLFSFHDQQDRAFLEYLQDIEKSASPEHVEVVREVYGADWGKPFVELLSVVT
jgi:hypothetical protein